MAGRAYTSTLLSGPRVRGEANKKIASEYLTVLAKTVPNGSAYIRFRWDWANSSDTGKWSTEQQCYSVNRSNRDLSRKRLLMRGTGPAYQVSIRSEDGKPFDIIGWAAWDSVDAVP